MEETKLLYQIAYHDGKDAFFVEWNKLPDEVLEKVTKTTYLYDISYYSASTGTIKTLTVVYFRKVKKFRKGIKQFETDNIIFGI